MSERTERRRQERQRRKEIRKAMKNGTLKSSAPPSLWLLAFSYSCLLFGCTMIAILFGNKQLETGIENTLAWVLTGTVMVIGGYLWRREHKKWREGKWRFYHSATIFLIGISGAIVTTSVFYQVAQYRKIQKTIQENAELFSITLPWKPDTAFSKKECVDGRKYQQKMLDKWMSQENIYPKVAQLAIANESVFYLGGCSDAWKPLYAFFEEVSKKNGKTPNQLRLDAYVYKNWPKVEEGCQYQKRRAKLLSLPAQCALNLSPNTVWVPIDDFVIEKKPQLEKEK